jgi:hypothetical protein
VVRKCMGKLSSIDGRFRVATLRNVDTRPMPDFVKAYMHNGYFKSLRRSCISTIPETPCPDAERAHLVKK